MQPGSQPKISSNKSNNQQNLTTSSLPIYNLKTKPYTLKTIENCEFKTETNQCQNKYYQITIPGGPSIRIYIMSHSILRLRVSFDPNCKFEEKSYSLVMTAWDDKFDQLLKNHRKKITVLNDINLQLKQNPTEGEYYYFQTSQLTGKIYKNPYGLQISNKNKHVIYRDLRGRALKRDLQGRVYHYCQIDPQNDYFYGFGENTGRLNKSGKRLRMAPGDALGYDAQESSSLYKHIPFYIKINKKDKHAIGLFYNNNYESVFDMGSQKNGYWPSYSYFCADGGDIDLFLINGPTMKRVVQRYTDLTGKTALAPIQSLGYIGSTVYYAELEQKCDAAIISFIKKCRKENTPISNFHLSSGYTVSENKEVPKRYVFTWNNVRFPNPPQFFSSMKQLGVSVSPNVKPGILTLHPYYQQFAKNGVFIRDSENVNKPYVDRWWGGEGSFFDFTNPQGRQAWKNKLKQQLISKGATTIWNDNNEYNSIDNRAAICINDLNEGENNYGIVDQLKPVQALLMAHVAEQALKQEFKQERPFIISRAGCAGIQRYASSWSGDNYTSWKTLKSNIATVLNMGLSGFANYGCDIGGFWGPAPSAELFLRWVQHGIFQPRFSIHSCNTDNTATQPWMFPQFSGLIAKIIRFRYMFLPYLYSLLYFSHLKGRPIMRPLAYEFQDADFQNCADQDQNFMFGPYLLVANILDPISKLDKQDKRNFINQGINKNSHNEQANSYDFTGFPIINFNVPNCVEMNESQEWNSQAKATSLLSHVQPQSKHTQKSYQNINQSAYKTVYLPKGCNWYSWNRRQKYQGGQTIQIKVNLQSIPLFVKDKSIIPLAIKFGKESRFDILDMNKQRISGLYIKIAYDNSWKISDRPSYLIKQRNFVEFVMYQDNGTSIMEKTQKKQEEVQSQLSISVGKFSRVRQNKLNEQIGSDASFLLTKITVRHPTNEKREQNPNMLLININRQGNLSDESICLVDTMILEIKSIDKAPNWITIEGKKCKHVLYENQWVKWGRDPITRQGQVKMELSQAQTSDQPGCWYYDHQKGAAILKINKNLVRPSEFTLEKYRNLEIYVCKDLMIQFSKEYLKVEEKIEEQAEETKSNQEEIAEEIIEQIVNGEKKQKTKYKRRIIFRENK